VFVFLIANYSLILYKVSGWNIYENNAGKYKVAYPRSWAIKDCGSGNIIISIKHVDQCYDPIHTPSGYLKSAYVQIFVYRNYYAWNPASKAQRAQSEYSERWRMIAWIEKDKILPDLSFGLFPYRPIGIPDIPFTLPPQDTQEKNVRGESYRFYMGYISNSLYNEEYSKIVDSVRFF
jgi:hypothetical protein